MAWITRGIWACFLTAATVFAQSTSSVQMYIASLSDSDPGIRMQAADHLAALGTDAGPAVPALIHALGDRDPDVRYAVVIALGKAGGSSSPTIKALTSELNDTSKDVRYKAAEALGEIGEAAVQAVEPLLKSLDSPDREMVASAGTALQKIKPRAGDVKSVVMRLLHEGDYTQKRAALDVLDGVDRGPTALDDDKSGPRIFNVLIGLLSDKAPLIREKALGALQSVQIPEDLTRQQLDALSSGLGDPEEDIRVAAVKVFARLKDEELRIVPLDLISDPYVGVRLAVIEAAGDDIRTVPPVLGALGDSSYEVRAAAISKLEKTKFGRDEICVAVAHAAVDRFASVRRAAAAALGDCPDPQSEEAIASLSKDPLAEVRIDALNAITAVLGSGWQARSRAKSEDSQLFENAVHALDDDEADVQNAAAATLQAIAPLPEKYLEAVAVHLKDHSRQVRTTTVKLVGSYGAVARKFVPQLRDLLHDEDSEVSQAAVESLGLIEVGDNETIDSLRQFLEGMSFGGDSLHEATFLSLGRIGPASKPAMKAVVASITRDPGNYDVVDAGVRSLREMGPEAGAALTEVYAKTPSEAPKDRQVTMDNVLDVVVTQPMVQKLIERYNDETKFASVHVKTPDGNDIDIQSGGRSVVIAIGTWCVHSRRLVSFLSNPRVRALTANWTFNFVLLDETPQIERLGILDDPEGGTNGFDKSKYPSPVPLYDRSLLARLPGKYFFYAFPSKQGIELPSVFEPDKGKFDGTASELVSRELGFPFWIRNTLNY